MLSEIATLLSSSTGELAYHFILAIALALILSQAQASRPRGLTASRWSLAAGSLLALRAIWVLLALVSYLTRFSSNPVLVAMSHFVSLFGVILLGWVSLFPRAHRSGDRLALYTIGFAVLSMLAIGIYLILSESDVPFSRSYPGLYWSVLGFVLSAAIFWTLISLQPAEWLFSTIGFVFLMLGFGLQLILAPEGTSPAVFVRLTELFAYPLLALGATRAISGESETRIRLAVQEAAGISLISGEEISEHLEDLELTDQPEEVASLAARSIAMAIGADFSLLLTAQDRAEDFEISAVYDSLKKRALTIGGSKPRKLPQIAALLQRRLVVNLGLEAEAPDLRRLRELFDINTTGPMLIAPLLAEKTLLGGVVVLSPYTHKVWGTEHEEALAEIATGLARRLAEFRKRTELTRIEGRALRKPVLELESAEPGADPSLLPDALTEADAVFGSQTGPLVWKTAAFVPESETTPAPADSPAAPLADQSAPAAETEPVSPTQRWFPTVSPFILSDDPGAARKPPVSEPTAPQSAFVQLDADPALDTPAPQIEQRAEKTDLRPPAAPPFVPEKLEANEETGKAPDEDAVFVEESAAAEDQAMETLAMAAAELGQELASPAAESLEALYAELASLKSRLAVAESEKELTTLLDLEHALALESMQQFAEDLRAPVESVAGYIELLLSESVGFIGSMQRKFLERARKALGEVDELIREAAPQPVRQVVSTGRTFRPVNLNNSIEAAALQVSPLLEQRGLSFRLLVPEDLESPFGSSEMIVTILVQMISAAVRSAPEGCSEIVLKVEQEEEQEELAFMVSCPVEGGQAGETGPLSESATSIPAIAGLVEELGGKMVFEYAPDEGSRCIVRLPSARAEKDPSAG